MQALNIRELGDKLSSEQKQRVEAALGRLKSALKGDSVNEIRSAADGLEGVWQSVSTELYQHAGAAQAGAGAHYSEARTADASTGHKSGRHDNDGTIDADYEVVE